MTHPPPACGHPTATVVDLADPTGLFVSSPLPCAWPGCWAGIDDNRATVTVPGRGSFVLRRTRRGGSWVWSFAGFTPPPKDNPRRSP
jgi:hypothetical protein